MSAEASFGAPTAHCNAAFLKQAGVPVDFIRLADIGIRGNGHFLMLENNNLEIAALQHLKQLWHVLVHYGVQASNAK